MRDRRVATRYAEALLDTARDQGVLDSVAESFSAVLNAVKGTDTLRIFLDSPQVPTAEKKGLLEKVFGGKVEPVLLTFFYLLIDKHRIENTRDIGEVFAELVENEQGYLRARVVTAINLPDDLAAALKSKLAAHTGKKIILEKKTDVAVIGGVCVTLGDKILDGTVRTNLNLLRKTLGQARIR
ncbi:MAG: ATP synthase F1 subunit delta [Candidatus Krumholzibacteria bacterium]|nr:ATP synthase F1 subunit delta [Candidatus Krumholzibacteria bacterium]